MVTYKSLSTILYREVELDQKVKFICSPSTYLSDEYRAEAIRLINEEIRSANGLTQYINRLGQKSFSEKYLFILGLIFCIPEDSDSERPDADYWRSFLQLSADNRSSTFNKSLLEIVGQFCRKHCIPFFDVYQNRNRTNICSRIYSLLPFTRGELTAISYIVKKEGIADESSFSIIKELVLTSYSALFNRATIEALKYSDEEVNCLLSQTDYAPQQYTFTNFFSDYLNTYASVIYQIEIDKCDIESFEEKLSRKATRQIGFKDFNFFFKTNEGRLSSIYLELKGASPGDVHFELGMPLSTSQIPISKILKYHYDGTAKSVKLDFTQRYFVTQQPQDNGWYQLKTNFDRRIYEKEIVGFTTLVEEGNLFPCLEKETPAPEDLIRVYNNIQSSIEVQLDGGLANFRERYMWFAIPEIILHNAGINDISLSLNGVAIQNEGRTIKDKFVRYVENRRNGGVSTLFHGDVSKHNLLVISGRGGQHIRTLEIEQQNFCVEKQKTRLEITACPIEGQVRLKSTSHRYDAIKHDCTNRGEHLLFWVSRFKDRGVSYFELRNAILSIYFANRTFEQNNSFQNDFSKITKRIIEQFIGLGFMEVNEVGGELRYVSKKSQFIVTHYGQLLYTGGSSYLDLKKILEAGIAEVDEPQMLLDKYPLPYILKRKISSDSLVHLSQNTEFTSSIAQGLEYNIKNGSFSTQSFPLYLVRSFEFNLQDLREQHRSDMQGMELFDAESLCWKPMKAPADVIQGVIIQCREYGKQVRFIAGQQLMKDGQTVIKLFRVKGDEFADALYFSNSKATKRFMGWIYDNKNCCLYIPIRLNVPHQIRQALQSCMGTYTRTFFVQAATLGSLKGTINGGHLLLKEELFKSSIEMERFEGIPEGFLSEIKEKLNIEVKNAEVV
jgi:hypothetical protein